ncbi:hypothetical protein JYU34_016068 [Plutella xylostella]|uniref:Uncharacterized protein n=1 Tax=Plutella xylostella TaxID=51655 RepID=A0ABQ7Q5C7_PLUXY|nr:hypothetical protein JYU34_016068 [Plutella xylostella]
MARMFRLIVLSYVGLVVFVLVNFGPNSDVEANQHRTKRYLAFLNISRFYIRLNTKAAMVPWTQIFTQAVGFRVNWDEAPDSFRPYKHLHRRELYTPLQMLLDRSTTTFCELGRGPYKHLHRRDLYTPVQMLLDRYSLLA